MIDSASNENGKNWLYAKKPLPDIIIQFEHDEPLGIRKMKEAVWNEISTLKSFLNEENQTNGITNAIRTVIKEYFKERICTVDSKVIEKKVPESNELNELSVYYEEDRTNEVYRLKEGLSKEQEKALFDFHLEHGLEPLIIEIEGKDGKKKYYSYLIIDLDSLEDKINTKAVIDFCDNINKEIESQNIKIAPNLPCSTGEPNSVGGPARMPVELTGNLIKELNQCRSIEQLREKIGFHGFTETLKTILESGDKERSVDIYILDTYPPDAFFDAGKYPDNSLMKELRKDNNKYCGNKLVKNNFNDPADNGVQNSIYMPDHGLFIAGLIRMLSNDSEIHLIQVLNNHISGDLRALIWGIAKTISLVNKKKNNFHVVNCSFTIKEQQETEGSAGKMAECLFENLKQVIVSRGYIFCAAGNDDLPEQLINKPKDKAMLPATLEGIYGVGALGRIYEKDDKYIAETASYSSIADITAGEAYWAFGGSLDGKGNYPDFSWGNSMVGLFASPEYPASTTNSSRKENTCGWIRGCGTSFAAGIASGTFAAVLSKYKSKSPVNMEQIINLVKTLIDREVIEKYADQSDYSPPKDNVIPIIQG